ncbi:MAG: shikimate dehydrogenase [Candidatus Ranarchaeia archaeon]
MPLRVNARTRLVCLLGKPVIHSLSPIIHNAAFHALDLNYVYVAFDVDDPVAAINGLKALNVHNFNVTAPHKIAAMSAVDVIDSAARRAGAMNTGYWINGELHGTNTDVVAVKNAFQACHRNPGEMSIVLLGAGGAARAVLSACLYRRVSLVNRTPNRAEALAKCFKEQPIRIYPLEALPRLVKKSDVFINATPIGRREEESPIPAEVISSSHLILDLVYSSKCTKLVRDARDRGADTVDGIEFLIEQGIASFKLWTNIRPPRDIMEQAIREAVRDKGIES